MAGIQMRILGAVLLLTILAVVGCTSRGDLGRIERGPMAQALEIRPTGQSDLNWTDEERDMRWRLRRFVDPQASDQWVRQAFPQVRSLRGQMLPEESYYHWLRDAAFASSIARYNRLETDIATDTAALPGLFASVCAVQEADRRRAFAAGTLLTANAEDVAAVDSRAAANHELISIFVGALDWRFRAYRHGLERLLLETPSDAGERVDLKLSEFASAIAPVRDLQFCP